MLDIRAYENSLQEGGNTLFSGNRPGIAFLCHPRSAQQTHTAQRHLRRGHQRRRMGWPHDRLPVPSWRLRWLSEVLLLPSSGTGARPPR